MCYVPLSNCLHCTVYSSTQNYKAFKGRQHQNTDLETCCAGRRPAAYHDVTPSRKVAPGTAKDCLGAGVARGNANAPGGAGKAAATSVASGGVVRNQYIGLEFMQRLSNSHSR